MLSWIPLVFVTLVPAFATTPKENCVIDSRLELALECENAPDAVEVEVAFEFDYRSRPQESEPVRRFEVTRDETESCPATYSAEWKDRVYSISYLRSLKAVTVSYWIDGKRVREETILPSKLVLGRGEHFDSPVRCDLYAN